MEKERKKEIVRERKAKNIKGKARKREREGGRSIQGKECRIRENMKNNIIFALQYLNLFLVII